ncbi:MAG: YebC/PmpR family DNA-binding transcriptional regulator [Myxococcota bacterium]|nr:YebC/PmpR family DNA-binding transcriptional regulator [Myxococcota bacterium]MDW8363889.1 YebC/PmpR family DNA-binding transcriptional regulator [Myxococcales bacterium]
MSGHNKWSSIKHRKGAQDARRGKLFTKLIKEITVAARAGGGDPAGNPRLRRALEAARAANMPADNITRAIKKGTGELEGASYEELMYEGVGPGGALLLVEVATDNRNRTASEVRKIFDRHGGSLGASGSAAWAFEHKGVVRLAREAATEERLFEVAVGAGADDLGADDEGWFVQCARESLDAVRGAIESAGMTVASASLAWIARTPRTVSGREAEQLAALLEALEDHDDVQNAWCDASFAETTLEAASG